jgi:hypothetical protein
VAYEGRFCRFFWTQQREDNTHPGEFAFRRDFRTLFAAPGDDIVLMKVSYWIRK